MTALKLTNITFLIIVFIQIIHSQLNQWETDTGPNGEDIWRSTSDFIPVEVQSFGTVKIGLEMTMEFDWVFWGRTNTPSGTGKFEMFFRVGYASTANAYTNDGNDCLSGGARYPSFWIANNAAKMFISISQGDNDDGKCQFGQVLSSYHNTYGDLVIGHSYHVRIYWNEKIYRVTVNDGTNEVTQSWARIGTLAQSIGHEVPVWWMSDREDGRTPYNRGNGTFSNITITSIWFTDEPTFDPTTTPTTTNPTSTPTTTNPTSNPTTQPTTAQPSFDPTAPPTTTQPTSNPTSQPTTAEPTSNPSISPTTSQPTSKPTTPAPNTMICADCDTTTPSPTDEEQGISDEPSASPTPSTVAAAPTDEPGQLTVRVSSNDVTMTGIAIGCVVVLLCICCGICILCRKKKKPRKMSQETPGPKDHELQSYYANNNLNTYDPPDAHQDNQQYADNATYESNAPQLVYSDQVAGNGYNGHNGYSQVQPRPSGSRQPLRRPLPPRPVGIVVSQPNARGHDYYDQYGEDGGNSPYSPIQAEGTENHKDKQGFLSQAQQQEMYKTAGGPDEFSDDDDDEDEDDIDDLQPEPAMNRFLSKAQKDELKRTPDGQDDGSNLGVELSANEMVLTDDDNDDDDVITEMVADGYIDEKAPKLPPNKPVPVKTYSDIRDIHDIHHDDNNMMDEDDMIETMGAGDEDDMQYDDDLNDNVDIYGNPASPNAIEHKITIGAELDDDMDDYDDMDDMDEMDEMDNAPQMDEDPQNFSHRKQWRQNGKLGMKTSPDIESDADDDAIYAPAISTHSGDY